MLKEETRTLNIDLTKKSSNIVVQKAKDLTLEEMLGGVGKSIHDTEKFLNKHGPIKDALAPENLLCVDTGILTGQKVMTGKRVNFGGLSPLKATKNEYAPGFFDSTASGNFGPALKASGFDSLRITGKLDNPSILVINNGELEIREVPELIGKDTSEKIAKLKEYYPKASSAVIGPAGENLVRYASIAISTQDPEHMRFAGRGGFGAVMGSKNILGIVAQGNNPKLALENTKDLNIKIATGKATSKYRELGTYFANIFNQPKLGVGIFNNFKKGYDTVVEKMQKKNVLEEGYKINDKGCLGCGIKCWKEIEKDGEMLGKIDYEPGALFGTNLGISDLSQIMNLIRIADKSGLDAISAGTCLGYEMEITNNFGNFEFAKQTLESIVKGEHKLGQGLLRYAGNAPNAMHTQGIEFPAYQANVNPGFAFAEIGGQHMKQDTYNAWVFKDPNTGEEATNSLEEWRDNIAIRGPYMGLYDILGLCKFAKVNFEETAELANQVYELNLTPDAMRNTARRVHMLGHKINKSQGFTKEDYVLPENCYNPIPEMTIMPHFNTKEFFNKVKESVFETYKNYNFD